MSTKVESPYDVFVNILKMLENISDKELAAYHSAMSKDGDLVKPEGAIDLGYMSEKAKKLYVMRETLTHQARGIVSGDPIEILMLKIDESKKQSLELLQSLIECIDTLFWLEIRNQFTDSIPDDCEGLRLCHDWRIASMDAVSALEEKILKVRKEKSEEC